ncbi:MAG: ECF transporter S component [Candidatus Bathycorpusculaceae bacterium]
MNSRKLAIITILTALAVCTNYALVSIPNVKLMDLICFIGGFMLGPFAGAFIGVLSWLIYGVLNPRGFVLQVWVATVFSESIYGIGGGLLRKANINLNAKSLGYSIFLGNLGFFLTLAYDIITNIAYAHVFGQNLLVAMAIGAPYTLLHEISNALLFSLCFMPLISSLKMVGVYGVKNIRK